LTVEEQALMTVMDRIVHNNVSGSLSDWVHQVWIPLLTGIKPSFPSRPPIQTCSSDAINVEAESKPSSASCSSSFKVSPQSIHVSKSQLEHASPHTMTQPNILEYLGMTTATTTTAVDHHFQLLSFLTGFVVLWSMILRAMSWLRRRYRQNAPAAVGRDSRQPMTPVRKRTRRMRQSLQNYSKTLSTQDQIVSESRGSLVGCLESNGALDASEDSQSFMLNFASLLHEPGGENTVIMWRLPHPGQACGASTERLVPDFCAICHCSYLVGDQVAWSSNPDCRHCFHVDCIVAWLVQRSNRQCPCCRQVFHPSTGSLLDQRSIQALEDRRRSH
jgi:Ring finger domain